jgi:GT2 family glycosyltransferase
MDLSIIIVNWNTRDLLRQCLASVPAAVGELATEILVVDNASHDGSAEMVLAEFPAVRLLESGGNLGFSRANNLALPHTRGRAVLLLNPDTVCPPASLARLCQFLHGKSNAAAVGPRLVDGESQPTLTSGYFPRVRDHWLGFLDPARVWLRGPLADRISHIPTRSEPSCRVDYVLGACFLMSRSALEKIGYLDDRFFMYFEETDWCWRAQQNGLEIWYCAETEITHLEGQAAEQVSDFALRQFQQSYRAFVAKNYGPRRVWGFRLAQLAEYGMKALLRGLLPVDKERNRVLARIFRAKARMQLMGRIEVDPPD